MKKIILLFTIAVLFTFPARGDYATVFIYHRFGDNRYPTTSVSMEDFEKQMEFLKKNNYNVISLDELWQMVRSGRKIPPKTVVITVDDGYRTTMKAFKVLKKYNFPFTVFLYMDAIGRYPDFLTLEQIEELKKYGRVTFGNHLYNHPDLAKYRASLKEEEYIEFLKRELELSEKRFKELFGKKPEFFAFPYGSYDRLSVKFLERRGYKLLMTQDRGSYNGKSTLVPRMATVGSLSSPKAFYRALEIEPLPIKSYSPIYGLLEENPAKISFELENGENYKNCSIYVSEYGWLKTKRTGNGIETKEEIEFHRFKNRIGIKCVNKKTNRRAEFFYLVINGSQEGANR